MNSILPCECGLSCIADPSPGLSNISRAPARVGRQFISCLTALLLWRFSRVAPTQELAVCLSASAGVSVGDGEGGRASR